MCVLYLCLHLCTDGDMYVIAHVCILPNVMYVCMYVCVYVCIYLRVYLRMYVNTKLVPWSSLIFVHSCHSYDLACWIATPGIEIL